MARFLSNPFLGALFVFVSAMGARAGAQDAPVPPETGDASQSAPADAEEARARFLRAIELLDAGRFSQARDLLRGCLELQQNRACAFNLAIALRGTGEIRESARVLQQLMSGHFGELPVDRRAAAQAMLEEANGDVAHIRVTACGAEEIDLRVDGSTLATLRDCESRTIELDPGQHVLALRATHAEPVEHTVHLEPGATEEFQGTLQVVPPVSAPEESSSVFRSGWFWAITGVVLAAGVTTAIILRTRPQSLVTDEAGEHIVALRFGER